MDVERTVYRERTNWPGWVKALFATAIVVSCYPLLAGWDTDLSFSRRLLIVGVTVGVAALVKLLVGGMTVLVQESRILIHMGSLSIIRKTIPFETIESLESVQYRPIRDFGGWGIRGWGRRRAWTIRGDRAVALGLADDRQFLIGSDYPMRLEARIRAAAGDQLSQTR